jgi:SET domain-containing protein
MKPRAAGTRLQTAPSQERKAMRYEVRESPIHRFGVFALRRIRKGSRIIEYKGERITSDEADLRYDDEKSSHAHVLLFTVDKDTLIDAGVGGNEARFINHSCAPNCEAVLDERRVFIEAMRDIAQGEELAYDYNLQHDGRVTAAVKRRYLCRCGEESCRGTMLAPPPKKKKKRTSKKA